MKAYSGSSSASSLVNWGARWGEWSSACTGLFTSGKEGSWVDPRACLDCCGEDTYIVSPGISTPDLPARSLETIPTTLTVTSQTADRPTDPASSSCQRRRDPAARQQRTAKPAQTNQALLSW
jgi:hypothetical protein